jgi:hypothetical protein
MLVALTTQITTMVNTTMADPLQRHPAVFMGVEMIPGVDAPKLLSICAGDPVMILGMLDILQETIDQSRSKLLDMSIGNKIQEQPVIRSANSSLYVESGQPYFEKSQNPEEQVSTEPAGSVPAETSKPDLEQQLKDFFSKGAY